MAIVYQIVCSLFIVAALVYFLMKNKPTETGASRAQVILAGFQVVLCGWFYALCISDILDINVNFSYVRAILNTLYAIAFLGITVYTLFTKHRKKDKDLKGVIFTYIVLIGVQCFVFPYGKESEILRIFEAAEGAVVFGLLIAVLTRLREENFCRKSLFAATILELIVAIENVTQPIAEITGDFLLVDIPLNYASLFMRPVLLASLTLAYRVWLDGRK